MSEHVVGVKTYILVFLALMILTGTTVGAAFVDLGALNPVIALTIAVVKGVLVVLFFMHVKYSSKMTKVVVISGFFFLLILLALTMTDYISRPWASTAGVSNVPAQQQQQ